MMIIHYFPTLYQFFVNTLHGSQRYDLAAEIIGSKSVLDIGCGTGLLADYVSDQASYQGLDLNSRLLGRAQTKGLNVGRMDCLNVEDYPEKDVYFICDLLHHINPDHARFVNKLVNRFPNKMIIVCEPYTTGNWIYEQIVKVLDYDYVNGLWRPEWYDEKELRDFYNSLLQPERIIEVGDDLIAVRFGDD